MTRDGVFLVVNPQAGKGKLGRDWPKLKKNLQEILHFNFELTQKTGDATLLTQKALEKGYSLIVSMGGDGTLNECVTGFLKEGSPTHPKATLGILPYGRGSDLARHLGISRDPLVAVTHLLSRQVQRLDVGKITWFKNGRKSKSRYFINNAYLGVGASTDYWSRRAPKFFGATSGYLYGLVRGGLTFKPLSVRVITEKVERVFSVTNLVVANGSYFGAGMYASPRAEGDDGLLDVVVIKSMPLSKSFLFIPRLYRKDYIRDEDVEFFRARKIELSSAREGDQIPIQTDGDQVNDLPVTIEILPKILRFKV